MWYKKHIRRHLCDMHIDDWNPEFLSKFDPVTYVENLKRARLQNAMLYFQSHVGLSYYPTASGKMHAAFVGREDMMKRTVDLCHAAGMSVTGYYSLTHNTWAHDAYPDWRMVGPDGKSKRESKGTRYGFCCPNHPEYRRFTETQIREFTEYFGQVEGMFYDMLFWPQMCYCKYCRARWEREVGGEIPTVENWEDEKWLLHMKKRREWMGEFAQWVTDLTKSLMPGVSVEHNVAFSAILNGTVANAEEVLDACDYAGGDRCVSPYAQSFTCKFYRSITKNQPFEYMFTRCAPSLSAHTQIKSEDTMRSAMFLTTAHHGATLIIDAIDPCGTMNPKVYDRIGKIFSEVMPYEPYLVGEPIEDVGFYYSLKSKFFRRGEDFNNYTGVNVGVETMIRKNFLSGVTGGFADLSRYPVIVAPFLNEQDAHDVERLIEYVRAGGKLYFSGAEMPALLRTFFNAEVKGRTRERKVYLAPKKQYEEIFEDYCAEYPMAFSSTAPIVEGICDETVIATVTLPYTPQDIPQFASIHSNPPGIKTEIPAVAHTAYGKGEVVWSAFPIESNTLYDYRNAFVRLLTNILGYTPTLSSDAPYDVELSAFRDGHRILLSSVLLTEEEKARRIEDFSVTVRCGFVPKRVRLLPEGRAIPAEISGDTLTFTLSSPRLFEMMEIS